MILGDLNVLLDVLQKREPHYPASAAVLDAIVQGTVAGAISDCKRGQILFFVIQARSGISAQIHPEFHFHAGALVE